MKWRKKTKSEVILRMAAFVKCSTCRGTGYAINGDFCKTCDCSGEQRVTITKEQLLEWLGIEDK